MTPEPFIFNVGQKVLKPGGDYTFPGTVVSAFRKLSGLARYVVEDDRGICHIFSAKNLVEDRGGCVGKLPEPTEAQKQCGHGRWRRSSPKPRHCQCCGLLMWDAGD